MRNEVLQFFGGDPVVAWLLIGSVCVVLAVVFVIVEGRRCERRKEEERARFARIASANRDSRGWPVPPGPKGFGKGRAA